MWRWFRWFLLGIGVLVIGFVTNWLFPISFYLPHQKPALILPIDPKYDSKCGLMPMGEKIMHPNAPMGHPGIDFIFNRITDKIPYISSMNGIIRKVKIYDNHLTTPAGMTILSNKLADVVIVNGPYQTVYSELDAESLPSGIKVDTNIKQGDLIGYGYQMVNTDGTLQEMIHWEFGSTSPVIDRFCPLTYFMPDSQARIEDIWAHTGWPGKVQYPDICNGGYAGKEEK